MHPNIRSLWLSITLALLSILGLSALEITVFKHSVALGQTVATDAHELEASRLKVAGEKAFQQSQYSEAIDKLQQALKIYQEIGNRSEQAAILNLLGMTYESSFYYQKMGESYQKALILAQESRNHQEEGIALNGVGDIYFYKSEYRKALEFFQKALNSCTDSSSLKCKALSLRNTGNIYTALGNPQKGLEYNNQALSLYKDQLKGDRRGEAITLNNIGAVYDALGEKQKALSFYNQALPLWKAVGDRRGEAYTLNNIGFVYDALGEKQKALSYFNQALPLRRAVGDRRGEAYTLTGIGAVYNALGEKQKALSFYNQALPLRRAVGDRSGEAITLNNIGLVYDALGEKQKALSFYNQALPLRKAVGDRSGEAYTLNNIGFVYDALGEKQKALSFYNQALPLRKAVGDRSGEAYTLNNIGLVYDALGEKQKALSFYNQALPLWKAVGDRSGEATTLNNIGAVYDALGEKQKALSFYNQALPLRKAVGDRSGEATTLNNIGAVYDALGEKQKALSFYNQALPLRKAVGDRSGEAYTLNNIGAVYDALGEKQKALSYFNQALPLWKAVGDRSGEATTLSWIGYLLAAQKQPALAIFFYKQSVNITESLRNDIRELPKDTQQTYTQTVTSRYRTLADLLLQQNRILEAQQVLDLLKVQELDDYLKTVRGNAQTAKGVDYLQPEQQILTQFNEPLKTAIQLGEELTQLRNIPEANRTPAQQQRITQLVNLEAQLNQQFNDFTNSPAVQTALAQLNPSTLRQTVDLADLDALRDNLRQLNAVLLYPLILPDRLELVITTPNSAPLRRTVNVSNTELNQTILEFRQQMQACETKTCTAADTEKVKALSQKLYNWLIKPLEADLKQTNAQSIIYSPDGQLRYIPLAALHDGNQWLTQRLRINNITAKSLNNLEPQSSNPQLKVLAGAFTEGRYQFNVGPQQFSFDGLPFTKKEISQLVAAVPGTTPLLDQSFSLAAITPRMNEYNVLHLATHAAFLPGQPENSFILFGNGDRATLRDIENWSLFNIDMVILSACETGLGLKLGDGVEILGLGYQFQNRGVKATIASLWQVNDESTQQLMNTLYTQLKQGNTSKTEALRQAQLTLIQGKGQTSSKNRAGISVNPTTGKEAPQQTAIDYSHPYYWAPFILIGNGL
jgi:CHAT domain-containing protein/tetratricopeptide (TPR) repeat protein